MLCTSRTFSQLLRVCHFYISSYNPLSPIKQPVFIGMVRTSKFVHNGCAQQNLCNLNLPLATVIKLSGNQQKLLLFLKIENWISCITLLRRTLLPWSIVFFHLPIGTVCTGDVSRVVLSAKTTCFYWHGANQQIFVHNGCAQQNCVI